VGGSKLTVLALWALESTCYSDPDQEYIYIIGSETYPTTSYILSDESSIPFNSTSKRYNEI